MDQQLRLRGNGVRSLVVALRTRLQQLSEAGAKIFLAHGYHGQGKLSKRRGSCHITRRVVDNRIAYSGSANFTEGGTKNLEMMFRHTGPIVDNICQILKSLLTSDKCEPLC